MTTDWLTVCTHRESPLAPGLSPVRVHYREWRRRAPMVMLHGGWGYEIYPFDRQIAALAATHRIVVPDRTGYGRSGGLRVRRPISTIARRRRPFAVIDALGLERPIVWGHSDGAVIALRLGLGGPVARGRDDRRGDAFLPRQAGVARVLRDDERRLRTVSASGSRPCSRASTAAAGATDLTERRRMAAASPSREHGDLYDGRLGELRVPTLVDPRRARSADRAGRARRASRRR